MCFFFFFNDTATTEIYTLSLHDALPISTRAVMKIGPSFCGYLKRKIVAATNNTMIATEMRSWVIGRRDRKSTRLNSSHLVISYAVFCLKKKKHKVHPTGELDFDCSEL